MFRQTKFRETVYTRAYKSEDLVGTCGGYTGLFLGYALIQFPRLIENMFKTVKQTITSCHSKETIKDENYRI